jgi:hypothetical protein
MKKISRLDRRKIRRKKNVLSLQLARDRARQSRGGSDVLSVNGRLLERLEAENEQLRRSVVDLMLQIQALRDDAR